MPAVTAEELLERLARHVPEAAPEEPARDRGSELWIRRDVWPADGAVHAERDRQTAARVHESRPGA